MLERRTFLLFFESLSEKVAGKTWDMPGLKEGIIAITEEKREPRKEEEIALLKLIISWTGLESRLSSVSSKIEKTKVGKANRPKMQGKRGSEKKKLYFRVIMPKTPEKRTITNAKSLLLSDKIK